MKEKPTKQTILIVEDDPQVMEVFSLMLEDSGYEVRRADSALPALLMAGGKLPDLILADLNMPHMNGLELIGQFKSYADTRNIPIIVVTGSDEPANRKAALKAGCAGYITKPVTAAKFLAQIAECLPKPAAELKPKRKGA
jgi:two-component system cell cycle response regulator DivK